MDYYGYSCLIVAIGVMLFSVIHLPGVLQQRSEDRVKIEEAKAESLKALQAITERVAVHGVEVCDDFPHCNHYTT